MTDWTPKQTLPGEFLEIARQVYAADPRWIPEEPETVSWMFGPQHRYFETSSAFLGIEPGQARLGGFHHPGQRINGRSVAFFGFWETMDSLDVNRRLFAEFERWARAKGAEDVFGPINFTTYSSYRLRLNHFDVPPFPGEPYNPAYYPALMKGLGYREEARYASLIALDPVAYHQRNDANLEDFYAQYKGDFRVETLSAEIWHAHAEGFYELADSIFSENFAYARINPEEFKQFLVLSLSKRFCTRSSTIVLDKDDRVAGACIVFPDYGPLICQGASPRLRLAEVSYEQHFPRLAAPLALFKTIGVMPQHRRSQLFSMMSYESARRMREYASFGAVLVREGNPSGILAERVCGGPTSQRREYALFAKSL